MNIEIDIDLETFPKQFPIFILCFGTNQSSYSVVTFPAQFFLLLVVLRFIIHYIETRFDNIKYRFNALLNSLTMVAQSNQSS